LSLSISAKYCGRERLRLRLWLGQGLFYSAQECLGVGKGRINFQGFAEMWKRGLWGIPQREEVADVKV
jgi:hypothetical protein